MRILLVENDPSILRNIGEGLRAHGFAVDTASAAAEVKRCLGESDWDAVILDIMLPGLDGVETVRAFRRAGRSAPVLCTSSSASAPDRVRVLEAGADDILVKPIDFQELLACVRAMLRRGAPSENAMLRAEGVELDLSKRCLVRGDRVVRLSHREFALMEFLLRNPRRVLDRTTIGEHVWDRNYHHESNVIDVYIKALRRKLGEPPVIHTIIGSGYMFSNEPP